MLVQVHFSKRYCGYWPGANPLIDEALARRLVGEGFCVMAAGGADEPTEVEADAPTLPASDPAAPIRKRGRSK